MKNIIARRNFLATLAACGAGCALTGRVGWTAESDAADFLDKPTLKAIERGLEFLAAKQQDDGSFAAGANANGRNPAVVGLCGMALLSSGSTPDRGPYGKHVSRCIDFILNHAEDSGFINVPDGATRSGPMYGHGFATLFLAETYGMTQRDDIREKLSRAVALIINTQNADGGWRYQPQREPGDISVTVCQIMALRAAGNAGLHVPRETLDRCIEFVKRSQNPDGGFMYMLQGGQSAFPRSAAGVVALYSAGIYEGPEIEKGLNYLTGFLPHGADFNRDGHYFYGHYYAVQAMWQAGGDYWRRWYPAIRDALVARQRDDGAWLDSSIGPEYGTAMACIILQMPNNYLPIFQR